MDFLKGKVTPKDWIAVAVMLTVIAAVAVVYVFFVRSMQMQKLGQLQADNAAVKADLQQAHEKQRRIEALRLETEKIQQLVSDFEKRLPSQREIPTLVRQFEQMANDVGLSHALKPEAPIRDQRKETLPYSVSTFGDFHQTASFINRVEKFERYLKVSNLKIEEEKEGVSKATFTLSTYRFLAPTPGRTAARQTPAAPRGAGGGS